MDSTTANTSTQPWALLEGITRRQKLSDTAVVITMQVSLKYIAVSLDNRTVHVFNSDGEPLHVLSGHSGNVWSLALNDETLLGGEIGGKIQSWNLLTGYESFHPNNLPFGLSANLRSLHR